MHLRNPWFLFNRGVRADGAGGVNGGDDGGDEDGEVGGDSEDVEELREKSLSDLAIGEFL